METLTVTTIGSAYRTARIPHACACGRTIRPGTRYERKVEMVEGSLEVTKIGDHLHAHELEEAALDAYWEARIDAR